MISLQAYAKLNLTLEVLRKREDGYHQILSVLQTISLKDEIFLDRADVLEIRYDPPMIFSHDLVLKAVSVFCRETGAGSGALIRIRKAIPIASGLGGGSSDAASVLKGLNKLWGLGLGRERLISISSKVSCDCPFFLFGGTALAGGRGEIITPIPPLSDHFFVLLFPPIPAPENKTETAYKMLKGESFTGGEYSLRLIEHLRRGNDLYQELLFNVFETVAFRLFPGLDEFKSLMLKAGASSVHLSGSGPTLFSPEKDPDKARLILKRLTSLGLRAIFAETVSEKQSQMLC